jgi:hypothetical protein
VRDGASRRRNLPVAATRCDRARPLRGEESRSAGPAAQIVFHKRWMETAQFRRPFPAAGLRNSQAFPVGIHRDAPCPPQAIHSVVHRAGLTTAVPRPSVASRSPRVAGSRHSGEGGDRPAREPSAQAVRFPPGNPSIVCHHFPFAVAHRRHFRRPFPPSRPRSCRRGPGRARRLRPEAGSPFLRSPAAIPPVRRPQNVGAPRHDGAHETRPLMRAARTAPISRRSSR